MILTSGLFGPTAISQDFQADFDGLILGAGTPYGITKWGGFLDMPAVRSQDDPIPLRDGIFAAANYSGGKTYDLEFDIVTNGVTAFSDAVALLESWTYAQVGLRPLRFQLPDKGVRVAMVQCRRRAIPVDVPYQFGMSAQAALQFYAPDARQYGPALSTSTGLRSGGGGLTFPLTFPLNFGTPPSGGRVSFVNSGSASSEPVFTVSGPLSAGFEITYVETGQRLRYQAPVGSDIVLDCQQGTVTTQGQQRATYLTIREWFSVPAYSTATFAFATLGAETALSTPTAGMAVTIAPAYL